MKKLIAILTIAIVLVGVVFATETAAGSSRIDITTCIKAREPNFRLTVTDTSADSAKYTLGSPAYSNVAINGMVAGAATIKDDELKTTGTNVTVSFAIGQISEALTYSKYYFSVVATALTLQEDENNTTAHIAELDAAEKTISVSNATPNITAATIAHVTAGGTGTAKISQKYTGTRIDASADNIVPVGTFEVTWLGNTAAVPGTYAGNVTLNVTVE